jgi:spore germination protein
MFSRNDKISVRQMQTLAIIDIFGTGVIALPRRAAEYAGADGWIIIILITLGALLAAHIMASVGHLHPSRSFVSCMETILSKPVAKVIGIVFALKLMANCALELRVFGEIVRENMLPRTPFLAIVIAMSAVSAYAASKGYEARARIAQILFPIIFLPLILIFVLALRDVDYTNLLPVFTVSPKNALTGAFKLGSSFTCLELLLIAHPFANRPKSVRKGINGAILFTGALMLATTVITLAKFGPFDVKRHLWPVLDVMDLVELPGSFIERQDALMLSFWILSNFAIMNSCLFFSSILLKDVFGKGKHSCYIIASSLIVAIASMSLKNASQAAPLIDKLYLSFGIAFMYGLPLVLLAVGKLRGLPKGGGIDG